MKVINKTAYATIGCDVQLTESDRLALGIELDKITNWLQEKAVTTEETEEYYKAIDNIVAFVSKFAIRPSETNVFTDSPEDFKMADEITTAVEPAPTDDIVTVNISNCKDMVSLTRIIFHATGWDLANISRSLHEAIETYVSYISFKCTEKSKEEVVNELADRGYTIESNPVGSLRVDTH